MGKKRFENMMMAMLIILAVVSSVVSGGNAEGLSAKAAGEEWLDTWVGLTIGIGVGLADSNRNSVAKADVPVYFYCHGNVIKSGDMLYSDEGVAVNVTRVDAYTDENGEAYMILQSSKAVTIRDITMATDLSYLLEIRNFSPRPLASETSINIKWVDPNAPTPTPTEPASSTPLPTEDDIPIVPPTVTSTPVPTPTPMPTPTKTPMPTKSPTPTKTPTPTRTPMPTKTPTPTRTPIPTNTPKPGNNNLADLNHISCYVKNTTVTSGGKQKPAVKVTWTEKEEAYKYQVYRSSEGKLSALRAVCDASSPAFIDTDVKKGVRYYYKVRALGGTVQNSYTGSFSSIKGITVPASLIKPVISYKKSKGKLTIYFKKAEGDKYQMQYLFGGRKQWKNGPSGKLSSKVTKGFNSKENVKIRIRTSMKVNGKQVYSKWSSIITVKA